jgi:DNA primase small subunit
MNGEIKDLLKNYYDKIFPFDVIFDWISYGTSEKTVTNKSGNDIAMNKRREICYTFEGNIFVRYNAFASLKEMETSIKKKVPLKIDIGPLYNHDLSLKKNSLLNFTAIERELIFDIDMNDYDEVRYCCEASNTCSLCWPLITCALRVIDNSLREDFGFEHIIWVYSGRRGVHCWVCDRRARLLSDEQRTSIVDYFKVLEGIDGNNILLKGVDSEMRMHPFVKKSIKLLNKYFMEHLLSKQGLLDTKERCEKILDMLPKKCKRTQG